MAKDIDTSYFLEEFNGQVESMLSQSSKTNELMNYIRRYFDKNNEILFDSGLSKRLIFKDTDEVVIFKTANIHPKSVSEVIRKTGLTEKHWKILNKPMPWLMTLFIRYYMINGKEKEMQQCLMYLALFFYSSLHFRQFPNGVNEDVMEYTVNNLSNKFDIKREGTLFKALYVRLETFHETYTSDLTNAADLDIKKYIMFMRDRLSSFVKNIATEYYKNYDEKNYLRTDKDNNSEENFFRSDNLSFQITRFVDRTMEYIITSGLNDKAANMAAKINDVSRPAVRTALLSICNQETKDVREFITKILQVYFISDGNSLESMTYGDHFINECRKIYAKSNTNDPLVIDIKDQLDQWLTKHSINYIRTERAATKGAFRRAIYDYFVILIRIANSQS